MREAFVVGVDSGIIQIARNPEHLKKAGDFYHKIQDLAGWSAASVWDGKVGGINTPSGDGPHTVIYDPDEKKDWRATQHLRSFQLVSRSPRFDPPAGGFTLYLGDSGRPDGTVKLSAHHYLGGVWLDDYTVQILTE